MNSDVIQTNTDFQSLPAGDSENHPTAPPSADAASQSVAATANQTVAEASVAGTPVEEAPVAEAPRRFLPRWHPDPVAWVVAFVGAALFISYSVIQWKAFSVPSWDLGIFTQLLRKYSELSVPIVEIKGPGFNLWGDHFHPLLMVLTPFYWLFPSGLTLLILQDLLFAWSAVPITRYARKRIGPLWGTVAGFSYILSWGLAEAVQAQFHEIALAVPLIAFGLVHWLEGRRKLAWVEIGLLVFVKEDLGLTVAMFGLILIWLAWGEEAHRGVVAEMRRAQESGHQTHTLRPFPKRTRASLRRTISGGEATTGLSFFIWGMFWFVAAIMVILPHFNSNGGWDYTQNLSESGTATTSLIGFLENLLGPSQKIVTVLLLLVAMGVVGLRSPIFFLMLPTLAWRFAGNVTYYWGWQWHYSAVLMPIAILALVDGVDRIRGHARVRPTYKRWLAGTAVVVSLFGSIGMAWNGPMGALLRGEKTVNTVSSQAAQGAIDAVGSGRSIRSNLQFLAYLIPDNTVYWTGSVGDAYFDTIVLSPGDLSEAGYTDPIEWANTQYGNSWSLVYSVDGYSVLKLDGTFNSDDAIAPEVLGVP